MALLLSAAGGDRRQGWNGCHLSGRGAGKARLGALGPRRVMIVGTQDPAAAILPAPPRSRRVDDHQEAPAPPLALAAAAAAVVTSASTALAKASLSAPGACSRKARHTSARLTGAQAMPAVPHTTCWPPQPTLLGEKGIARPAASQHTNTLPWSGGCALGQLASRDVSAHLVAGQQVGERHVALRHEQAAGGAAFAAAGARLPSACCKHRHLLGSWQPKQHVHEGGAGLAQLHLRPAGREDG